MTRSYWREFGIALTGCTVAGGCGRGVIRVTYVAGCRGRHVGTAEMWEGRQRVLSKTGRLSGRGFANAVQRGGAESVTHIRKGAGQSRDGSGG